LFLVPSLYVLQQKTLNWLLDREEPAVTAGEPEPGST
jgi:hypothetical protein